MSSRAKRGTSQTTSGVTDEILRFAQNDNATYEVVWKFVLALVVTCLLPACSSSQQFFQLSASGPVPVGSSGLSVGVGPISLPSYIDRPELVFQSDTEQFQVPANIRWIGSLRENVCRVVAVDLGRILGSSNVRSFPQTGAAPPSYRIPIDIRQFHAVSGSDVILEVSWRIEGGATGQTISRQSGDFREPISGDGYAAVVAAESRVLEQLAAALARSLPRG